MKSGDIVKVKDWGKEYCTYKAWFVNNARKLQTEWLIRYAYGRGRDSPMLQWQSGTGLYEILFIENGYALITAYQSPDKRVYLIGSEGLVLLSDEEGKNA